ncbi:MAG TPA: hypothetical protein PLB18_16265, partial [Acidobacteriota bacterium]|nr:hypothetical protein [Acidobacteriota bacterium]
RSQSPPNVGVQRPPKAVRWNDWLERYFLLRETRSITFSSRSSSFFSSFRDSIISVDCSFARMPAFEKKESFLTKSIGSKGLSVLQVLAG